MKSRTKTPNQQTEVNGEFAELAKNIKKTNAIAKEVMEAKESEAGAETNGTGVAKRIAKRMTKARAGSGKSTKAPKTIYQTGIKTTIENARKVNKALPTFVPEYVSAIPALDVTALDAMYLEAFRLDKEVTDIGKKHSVNLNKRAALYKGLNPYAARLIGQLKACGADKVTLSNARKILKKMRGVRIIPININSTENHISAAHTGFSDKLALFNELIELIANYEGYALVTGPNSEAAMRAHYAEIDAANDDADTTNADVKAAIRVRNAYFNTDITGLVDTYQRVKANVKAMYGTTSAEYKSISGLAFRKIEE